MLLRVEDLSKITGLSLINAFMLGGQIICVSKYLDHDWTMYKIDPDTFAVKRFAEISLYGICVSSLKCISQVVVHNNVAYVWSDEESILIAGTFEPDEFHWELVEIDIPEILGSDDCEIVFGEGTTATLTMLVNDSMANCPIICQLNLTTKKWIQYEVIDEIFADIKERSRYIWTTNGKVHLITYDTAEHEIHMVMDIKTKQWKVVDKSNESNVSQCETCIVNTHFIHADKLYKLGTDDAECSIYLFDDSQNKWIKKCGFKIDQTSRFCTCNIQPVVSGDRVFLLTKTYRHEWHLSKVYVIDMEPCLLTRALTMVRSDRNLMKVGEEVLPCDILSLLNRDTTGDSLAIQEMAEYFASL